MGFNHSKIKAARASSNLSQCEAAEVVGLTVQTYRLRESAAGDQFRLVELEKLYKACSETGKELIVDAVIDYLHS